MKTCTLLKRTWGINHLFFAKAIGFLCLVFLLLSTQAHSLILETDSGVARELTEQESWVLVQIGQGKEADLKKRFGEEKEKYLLGADFLEKLLTDGFKNITISHRGVKIANATIESTLNLENAEINHPVYLTHCIFKAPINLQKSYFTKDLSFQGSEFLKSASFKGIKIEGSVICDGTIFEAESLWSDAKIGVKFHAEKAEFRSKEGKADFNAMKVGASAFFTSAIFHGPVDFVVANIGIQFNADGAKFLNPEKLANFGGITTGNTIFFQKAEFHGPIMFELAVIGVNFRGTGVGFLGECQEKNLSKMKVAHKLFLDGAFICGDVNLSYGNFFDLVIDGAPKDGSERIVYLPHLNLKGSLVQRDLTIANVSIGELNASQMKVNGHATIKNVQITKLADFRSGSFQALDFINVKWPEVNPKGSGRDEKKRFLYNVYLGELTYSSLSIDKPESESDAKPDFSDYNINDFKIVTNFVDTCPFNTQSYVQLETFFKRIGRENWANKVFMRMNNRELSEKMKWYDPRRWLEWFFWGKIAGYGRAPFRVFFLGLAFIILGACLFDPVFLKENKISHEGKLYKSVFIRLFISLDRFLPIELGLAKNWDVQGRRFPIWLYFFLQQVVGWILIPIALASIYSQLK